MMSATMRRKPQGKRTHVALYVAGNLLASCAQFVAGEGDRGDSEASVDRTDVLPNTQPDAPDDALRPDAVLPTTFQPSYRFVVSAFDDGSPAGGTTLFGAATASPSPSAQDPGYERLVDRCVLRRNVGWINKDLGSIRVESSFGVVDTQFDPGFFNYSGLLARRLLPVESLIVAHISAGDGFVATRLSVTQPIRVESIYPAAGNSRTPAPLDLALPIRWRPVESRFSMLIDVRQTVGSTSLIALCSVPTALGTYTLPPEVIAAIDRRNGKSIKVGPSDLTVGTVRGVQTRFYSHLAVATISDSP